MRDLVVLGAGTAGTMVVNKLRPRLDADEWRITIIDQSAEHHYQPGYLFIPFGVYRPDEVVKPTKAFIPAGVSLVKGTIEIVDSDSKVVRLSDGTEIGYDYLVIAT
ncbi:MAG: NAD(P)/FAD-dependent oxidoreductase, partial [Actinobacteria bacterium]